LLVLRRLRQSSSLTRPLRLNDRMSPPSLDPEPDRGSGTTG
jgi:hypothetical protein